MEKQCLSLFSCPLYIYSWFAAYFKFPFIFIYMLRPPCYVYPRYISRFWSHSFKHENKVYISPPHTHIHTYRTVFLCLCLPKCIVQAKGEVMYYLYYIYSLMCLHLKRISIYLSMLKVYQSEAVVSKKQQQSIYSLIICLHFLSFVFAV